MTPRDTMVRVIVGTLILEILVLNRYLWYLRILVPIAQLPQTELAVKGSNGIAKGPWEVTAGTCRLFCSGKTCTWWHLLLSRLHETGGGEFKSEVGGLSSTGKSFRVVRACARCVWLVRFPHSFPHNLEDPSTKGRGEIEFRFCFSSLSQFRGPINQGLWGNQIS